MLVCGVIIVYSSHMKPKNLYDKTAELLQSTPISIARISREIDIDRSWINRSFRAQGRSDEIKHPSVHLVQRLHNYLVRFK
jgi:hypothetical protein